MPSLKSQEVLSKMTPSLIALRLLRLNSFAEVRLCSNRYINIFSKLFFRLLRGSTKKDRVLLTEKNWILNLIIKNSCNLGTRFSLECAIYSFLGISSIKLNQRLRIICEILGILFTTDFSLSCFIFFFENLLMNFLHMKMFLKSNFVVQNLYT